MVDFAQLRKRSGTNFAALQKTLEKTERQGFQRDERLWHYGNKDDKSSSIIRFLPIGKADFELVKEGKFSESDLTPVVKIMSHSFKGPTGAWFIENSLQTFGEACPVREFDGPQWGPAKEKDDKAAQDILKQRLPRTSYTACIYVIKDSVNPENEGKIRLFRFGETIKKMIEKAGNPEFETEQAFDPFCFWEGADLILNLTFEERKIGTREVKVPLWDNVKWANPAPFLGADESAIKEVWENQYSLLEFLDRKNFKTYEELREKYLKVMGLDDEGKPDGTGASLGKSAKELLTEGMESTPAPEPSKALESTAEKQPAKEPISDDMFMSEFEELLNS